MKDSVDVESPSTQAVFEEATPNSEGVEISGQDHRFHYSTQADSGETSPSKNNPEGAEILVQSK